jgi:hypothetical protein
MIGSKKRQQQHEAKLEARGRHSFGEQELGLDKPSVRMSSFAEQRTVEKLGKLISPEHALYLGQVAAGRDILRLRGVNTGIAREGLSDSADIASTGADQAAHNAIDLEALAVYDQSRRRELRAQRIRTTIGATATAAARRFGFMREETNSSPSTPAQGEPAITGSPLDRQAMDDLAGQLANGNDHPNFQDPIPPQAPPDHHNQQQ